MRTDIHPWFFKIIISLVLSLKFEELYAIHINLLSYSCELQVTVPKGSLCNLRVKFNVGLPPDAIYNIVIDPENKRVFKNIKVCIRLFLDDPLFMFCL